MDDAQAIEPRRSDDISELAAALAQAQGEFPDIVKDRSVTITSSKTGSKFTYNYADLANIIKSTRPILKAHKLAVSQLIGDTSVTTILMHASGQYLRTSMGFNRSNDIKEVGGMITYIRRYQLSGILGLSAEEDTDGSDGRGPVETRQDRNLNTKPAQRSQPSGQKLPDNRKPEPQVPAVDSSRAPVPRPNESTAGPVHSVEPDSPDSDPAKRNPHAISEAQRTRLFAIANANKWKKEDVKIIIKSCYGLTSSKDIDYKDYDILCKALQETKDLDAAVDFIFIRRGNKK